MAGTNRLRPRQDVRCVPPTLLARGSLVLLHTRPYTCQGLLLPTQNSSSHPWPGLRGADHNAIIHRVDYGVSAGCRKVTMTSVLEGT